MLVNNYVLLANNYVLLASNYVTLVNNYVLYLTVWFKQHFTLKFANITFANNIAMTGLTTTENRCPLWSDICDHRCVWPLVSKRTTPDEMLTCCIQSLQAMTSNDWNNMLGKGWKIPGNRFGEDSQNMLNPKIIFPLFLVFFGFIPHG